MDCYGAEKAAHEGSPVMKKSTSVIGVYSPVGRTQKTSFALTLGQILAKDRAVLYLNLESYSGFEQILGETYERNLSDLLYFVRQENANVIHRLSGHGSAHTEPGLCSAGAVSHGYSRYILRGVACTV